MNKEKTGAVNTNVRLQESRLVNSLKNGGYLECEKMEELQRT